MPSHEIVLGAGNFVEVSSRSKLDLAEQTRVDIGPQQGPIPPHGLVVH